MKKLALSASIALGLFLLTSMPLSAASSRVNPCDNKNCWDLSLYALYWSPVNCIADYATTFDTVPEGGKILGINPDYEWGIRIKGSYTTNCLFTELSYLYFSADDSTRDQDVTSLIIIRKQEDNLITKLNYEYQNVDLCAGFTAFCRCYSYVRLFANARWVYLHKQLKQIFTSDNNSEVSLGSEFNGGGIGIGIRGRYAFCEKFGLNGLFNPLALIGSHKTDPLFVSDTQLKYSSYTSVVPGFDFCLSLDYQWACKCVTIDFEFGYELNYYFIALAQSNGTRETVANFVLRRQCEDVGFA